MLSSQVQQEMLVEMDVIGFSITHIERKMTSSLLLQSLDLRVFHMRELEGREFDSGRLCSGTGS